MPLHRPVIRAALVLALAAGGVRAASADDPAFVPIFNGTSLAGWEGRPDIWRVEDGVLVGETTKPLAETTYLVWRQGLVDDFELRLAYRITAGNSGIQYRSRDLGGFTVAGYQADLEAGPNFTGILYEQDGRAIMTLRGERTTFAADGAKTLGEPIGTAAELQAAIKAGDWNEYRIVASGPRLQHFVNGQLMAETVDEQAGKRAAQGVVALQVHQGPPMKVEFKDIRLKRRKLTAGRKKLVLVAGRPSHGPGEHEFRAGCLLAQQCLDAHHGREPVPRLVTEVHTGGWPADPTAFDNADAIFFFADGGDAHPVIQRNRLAEIDALAKRGVGIACLHYAVEVPKEKGGPEFLDWLGGYFEAGWSVNPIWTLAGTELAAGHPITRGVHPFELRDEWYFHMRFRDPPEGLTRILTAVPPDATREGPDDPHRNNPTVRAERGARETLAWAWERPDGGRGFGCTGAHFHRSWGDPNFRTLLLNALEWTAGLDVPPEGIVVEVTAADLAAHQDDKGKTP